jgi:hypothetical protein
MHIWPIRPEPSPIKPQPRPFDCAKWLVIVLVTIAAVSATLAINNGRVW